MFSSPAIILCVVLGNHCSITSTSVIVIFVALIISNNQVSEREYTTIPKITMNM